LVVVKPGVGKRAVYLCDEEYHDKQDDEKDDERDG
jgi:hypothetical protein